MKKSRIVWTTSERVKIVEESVRILRAYPSMPMFRAVGEAQSALLPPHRQRSIINKMVLGDLVKDIERLLNTPVHHVVETGKYETVMPSDDAIDAAARAVAEKFEARLRAALLNSTSRVVREAAEGKL